MATQTQTSNGSMVKSNGGTVEKFSDYVKQNQAALKQVAAEQVDVRRLYRLVVNIVRQTPQLMNCKPASIFKAMQQAAEVGLEPGGALGHSYILPYKDEAQFIIGYRGFLELARRSGLIATFQAFAVYEGDKFDVRLGDKPSIDHVPNWDAPRSDEKLRYVYAIARMKDGSMYPDVMTKADVDRIRSRSRAGNTGPWVSDYAEMAKKGLALDTPIPTPSGWTTMGELSVDDTVFDMEGQPTKVTDVSEVKHLPCYRVTFANGEQIVCDDEHRWFATTGKDGCRTRKNGWPVKTINDLCSAKESGEIVSMPVACPLACDRKDLPISPWALGYWLGNGNKIHANVTCHSDDTNEICDLFTNLCNYEIGTVRPDSRSRGCSISVKGMLTGLRAAGLLGNKHIPEVYLRGSSDQRADLLNGLMDSDGHIDKSRGRAIFASTDALLAEQVYELVISLGETVTLRNRVQSGYGKSVTCYRIEWTPSFCPCRISRKAVNYRARKIASYRGVASIERIESVPTRCIAVASDTKSYLASPSMIPTHNTVVRRLAKYLPLSIQMARAVDIDEVSEFGPLAGTDAASLADDAPTATQKQIAPQSPEPPVDAKADALDEDITEGGSEDLSSPHLFPPDGTLQTEKNNIDAFK